MTSVDRLGRGSRALVAVAVGALAGLATLLPPSAAVLARADAVLGDLALRLAGERPPPAGLAVVAIDDADVAAWGGWPIDRGRWPAPIQRLDAAGARTIGLDVLLEGRAPADARLAAAMRAHGDVLLSAGRRPGRSAATAPTAVSPPRRRRASRRPAGARGSRSPLSRRWWSSPVPACRRC